MAIFRVSAIVVLPFTCAQSSAVRPLWSVAKMVTSVPGKASSDSTRTSLPAAAAFMSGVNSGGRFCPVPGRDGASPFSGLAGREPRSSASRASKMRFRATNSLPRWPGRLEPRVPSYAGSGAAP